MLLALASLVTLAAAAPATYDQRQDGELNISADVQNVLLVVAVPKKMSLPIDLLDDFLKSGKSNRDSGLQERADHVMEAFVEPDGPYRVEIGGGSDRSTGGDARAAEVVIAGRRWMDMEAKEVQAETDTDEIKLLGATEQCGPDRERDPVSLTCRFRSQAAAQPAPINDSVIQPTPEVIPIVSS